MVCITASDDLYKHWILQHCGKNARLIRGNSPYIRGGEIRKKDTRKHKKLEVGKQKKRGCFTDTD